MNVANNAENRIQKIRKLIATVYHQSKYSKIKVTNPQSAIRHIDFVLKCLHIKNLCFNELCNMLIEEDRGTYVELFKILFSIMQMFLKSGLVELYLKVQRDSEKEPTTDDNKQRANFHRFLGDNTEQDLKNNVKTMQGNLLKNMHKGVLTRSFEKLVDQNFSTKGLEVRKDDRQYIFNDEKENSNAYHAYGGKDRDQEEQLEKDALKLLDDLENGRFEKTELVKDPILLLRVNEKLAETVLTSHLKLDKRVDKWIEKLGRVAYDKDNFKEMIDTLTNIVDRTSNLGDPIFNEDKTQQNSRLGNFKLDDLERHVQEKFGDGFRLLFRKLLKLMQEARKYNVEERHMQTELTAIALEEDHKKNQADKRKIEDELSVLQSQIIEHENTIDHLRAVNANLEARCIDSSRQLSNSKDEYDKLEKDSLSIVAECKALKNQIDFLQNNQNKMNSNFRNSGKRVIELQSQLSSLILASKTNEEEEKKFESRVETKDDLKYFAGALDQFANFIKSYVAKTVNVSNNQQQNASTIQPRNSMMTRDSIINNQGIKTNIMNKLSLLSGGKGGPKDGSEMNRRSSELRKKFKEMINDESISMDDFLVKILEHTNISNVEAEINETIVIEKRTGSNLTTDQVKPIKSVSKRELAKRDQKLGKVEKEFNDVNEGEEIEQLLMSEQEIQNREEELSQSKATEINQNKELMPKNVVVKNTVKPQGLNRNSTQKTDAKVESNGISNKTSKAINTSQIQPTSNNNASQNKLASSKSILDKVDNSKPRTTRRSNNIRIRQSKRTLTKSISEPSKEIIEIMDRENAELKDEGRKVETSQLAFPSPSHQSSNMPELKQMRNVKVTSRGLNVKPETLDGWQQTSFHNLERARSYDSEKNVIKHSTKPKALSIDNKSQIISNAKCRATLEVQVLQRSKLLQPVFKPTYESALATTLELPNNQITQMFYYLKHYLNIGSVLIQVNSNSQIRKQKMDLLLPDTSKRESTRRDQNSGSNKFIDYFGNDTIEEAEDSGYSNDKMNKVMYYSGCKAPKAANRGNSFERDSSVRSNQERAHSSQINFSMNGNKLARNENDVTILKSAIEFEREAENRSFANQKIIKKEFQADFADKDLRKINDIIYGAPISSMGKKIEDENKKLNNKCTDKGTIMHGSNFSNFQSKEYERMSSYSINKALIEKLKQVLDVKKIEIDPLRAELQSRIKKLIKKFSNAHANCRPICKHLLYFEKHMKDYISRKLNREAMKLPIIRFEQVKLPERKTFLPLQY